LCAAAVQRLLQEQDALKETIAVQAEELLKYKQRFGYTVA
jgi:hypothetical protein